jgi:transposase
MKKKNSHSKVVFKTYQQNQSTLLPPNLDDLIPKNHLVRLLNGIIDQMNIDYLLKGYKGGGTSSYHPRMLLKVLIYAYTQRIYSSRLIAKALRENIHFMWLSGGNRPDFRTINRFRSSRLKGTIETVFGTVLEMLLEEGLIDLRDYFLDGTKVEANANKYSFVWGKATKKFKSRLQSQLKELLHEIDETNREEQARYGDRDLEEMGEANEIDSERIEQKLKELEDRLKKDPEDKSLSKAIKKISNDYLPRQKKYEEHEKKLKDRNSYSKTDEDATFMRMKEDHMRNGQLKPGYNIQMGTQNQFIIGYSIHQKPTDTSLLIPHLEHLKTHLGHSPENIIADAGYGSEENYHYLNQHGITAYVKDNDFHYEQTRKYKRNKFKKGKFTYDPQSDTYQCPSGERLYYVKTVNYKTVNGYKTTRRIYQASHCQKCHFRTECYRGKYNRRIYASFRLDRYRKKARELLESERGKTLRSQRPIEVESVFGQIKHNRHFRRFMLRGLEKVTIEYGLIVLAHNMMKWASGVTGSCYSRAIYFFKFFIEYYSLDGINNIENQLKYA